MSLLLWLETRPISSNAGRSSSRRPTRTPNRRDCCTWKRRPRTATMSRPSLWKSPRSCPRTRSSPRGKLSPSWPTRPIRMIGPAVRMDDCVRDCACVFVCLTRNEINTALCQGDSFREQETNKKERSWTGLDWKTRKRTILCAQEGEWVRTKKRAVWRMGDVSFLYRRALTPLLRQASLPLVAHSIPRYDLVVAHRRNGLSLLLLIVLLPVFCCSTYLFACALVYRRLYDPIRWTAPVCRWFVSVLFSNHNFFFFFSPSLPVPRMIYSTRYQSRSERSWPYIPDH